MNVAISITPEQAPLSQIEAAINKPVIVNNIHSQTTATEAPKQNNYTFVGIAG